MGNKISKLEKEAFLHQSSFEKSDGDGCIDGYLNGRWEQSYKSFKQGAQWQREKMWIPVEEMTVHDYDNNLLEKEAFLHQSSFEKSDGDGCIVWIS